MIVVLSWFENKSELRLKVKLSWNNLISQPSCSAWELTLFYEMILNEIRRITTDFEMAVMGFIAPTECWTCVRGNDKVHASRTFLALAVLCNKAM